MDALDDQALKSFLDNVDDPELLDNFRNDIYNETFTQSVKNIISEVEDGIKFIKNDNDDVKIIVIADHGQGDMVSMM